MSATSARGKRVLSIALRVVAGLAVGLALSEVGFRIRDHAAFPHLNCYVADAELGVRLRPGAIERISFGGNPTTSVRINAEGYRGEDWGAPGEDETLVVGDSQAFGLGVEEAATFSAALERTRGKGRVFDAGVPTYGPPELERVIAAVLEKRSPKTVVYAVNFVNDPFEARRPNVARHAVWDGWAVRRETAPASLTSFPGRELLYRESHAFFAMRQWLFAMKGLGLLRTPSEGVAEDLVSLGAALAEERVRARDETELREELRDAATREATLLAINADQRVKQLAFQQLKLGTNGFGGQGDVYLASGASPGDIVVPQLGEEGRPLAATAEYVQQAAKLRDRIEHELRERALAHATEESGKTTLDALERRDAAEKSLRELLRAPVQLLRATQPIVAAVLRAKKLVEAKGARFVLLALPMDVQISDEEWAKYGEGKRDMSQSLSLVRDLVEAVRDEGGTAVDPTLALRAGEPGAFLDKDPHLSAKGHEIVGKALAEALAAPPSKTGASGPLLALPEGRSRLPRSAEWGLTGELQVHGSDAAGCRTQHIREWTLVRCTKQKNGSKPTGVRVTRGGHGEAMALVQDGVVTLVAPVLRGDDFEARFSWEDRARTLVIHWPAELVETDRSLVDAKEGPDPPAPQADLAPICACLGVEARACDTLVGYPDPACMATYPADCARMRGCIEGNPAMMPACKPGERNAGAALHCFATCESDGDCKVGHCIDSHGAKLCIAP